MSSNAPQSEANPITACTVSRDVQNFDLLIEDMEAALGENWGILDLRKPWPFLASPKPKAWSLLPSL